ncbi:MAG: flagellar filament capping protein FliD [Bacteroidota bacterium]
MSVSSIIAQTSSFEPFVAQLVELEGQKLLQLESEQSQERSRKSSLGIVTSAVSQFESTIEELQSPLNDSFEPFSFSSSDTSTVEVNSVDGFERETDFNITVNRLATNDIALSQVMSGTGTDLAAAGSGSVTLTIGDKTETITLDTTKDDGSGGTVDMTNEEILTAFSEQISSLFNDEARASVFQVDSTNVQFSVQSLATGFDERIQFSDATGVLASITGGVTKLTPESDLNAQFTIDGVNFERSSNTINDAITGLDFTLKEATGEQEELSVTRDISRARSNVQSFIDSFNDLNTTLRNQTFINSDTGQRGALQEYRSIRNLTLNVRQLGTLNVSGISDGQIANLSDIGITFENSGRMVLDDADKLEAVLQDRPEEVTNLFRDDSSPISLMRAQAESFTEAGGILDSIDEGLDDRIDRLTTRIRREQTFLEEFEAEQRRIFNQLDLIIEQGQSQFDQVASFANTTVQAPQFA